MNTAVTTGMYLHAVSRKRQQKALARLTALSKKACKDWVATAVCLNQLARQHVHICPDDRQSQGSAQMQLDSASSASLQLHRQ